MCARAIHTTGGNQWPQSPLFFLRTQEFQALRSPTEFSPAAISPAAFSTTAISSPAAICPPVPTSLATISQSINVPNNNLSGNSPLRHAPQWDARTYHWGKKAIIPPFQIKKTGNNLPNSSLPDTCDGNPITYPMPFSKRNKTNPSFFFKIG